MTNRFRSPVRRGGVLIYVTAMMPLLLIIIALSVDFGRLLVAKNEIDTAVNAAVRAGGTRILEGATYADVLATAKSVAESNKVDSAAVKIKPAGIKIGVYVPATKQFYETTDMSVVNAIRVSVDHSFDNDSLPLFFWKFASGGADKVIRKTQTIMVADVSPTFITKVINTTTPGTTTTTPGTTTTTPGTTNTQTNTTTQTTPSTTVTITQNPKSPIAPAPPKKPQPKQPKQPKQPAPPVTNTNTTTNTNTIVTQTTTTTPPVTTTTPPVTTSTPATTTTTTVTTQTSTGKKFLQQVD